MPQIAMHGLRVLATACIAVLLASPLPSAVAAGGGDITFTPANMEPVHFSHDYHLKQRGLKCIACHNRTFLKGTGYEMKREAVTKNGFCALCHNGMKAFDLANKNSCVRCHKK